VSDLSGKLSSVIHAALLANGVQLTGKELSPVSVTVAGYVRDNFEGVTKSVNEELTVLKKQKAEAESLVKQSAPVVPAIDGGAAKVRGNTNVVPDAVESNVYRGPVSGEPFTGSATSSTLKPPPPPGGRAK
jgi:hypothetical protein